MAVPLTEEDLHELYLWVDDIPISRPKRNIARDFSDGCCVAEVVKFFFPKLVDLHNYTPAMSIRQKTDNWNTLNNRVFRKLHFEVPAEEINDITAGVPGAIERFLRALRTKIGQIKARREEMGAITERQMSRGHMPRSSAQRSDDCGSNLGGWGMSPEVQVSEKKQQRQQHHHHFDPKKNFTVGPDAGKGSAALCLPTSPIAVPDAHQHADNLNTNHMSNDTTSFRLLLDEKDRTIFELRETVSLLSEKAAKLEMLVRIKDEKLNSYRVKLGCP